jgi:hypothetical protein
MDAGIQEQSDAGLSVVNAQLNYLAEATPKVWRAIRWYYFPCMTRNEATLLKCYDSSDDGRARFAAHTSFDDPNSPPNAAPRESIEVRALVL